MSNTPHIFEGFGLELEYMIVDQETLNVLPIADQLLTAAAGSLVNDVERGNFEWSNELALHVIEMKTNGPAASITGLAAGFDEQVKAMNQLLKPMGATLLPSAMHPWIDPYRETKLWPHGYRAVYEAYNRIFNCQGHGWSNLQSVHLNLGFQGDDEFGRLHAAIRLILPLLPALAASSPFVEGRATGVLDNRLEFYRHNQKRIPSLTGDIIPEQVYSRRRYEEIILQKNYQDIAPHDPERILQDEWLNSRGAIARFQRSAIEIRLLDIQECPAADMAICTAIVGILRALVAEQWSSVSMQQAFPVQPLADLLLCCIRDAEQSVISDTTFLRLFGVDDPQLTAGDLWKILLERTLPIGNEAHHCLDIIIKHGPLARRLLKAAGDAPHATRLHELYRQLAICLAQGEMFLA
ncbi:MAG: glutamate-cysteine ligase family protein [Desulfobulbaceae bacterium]|nr:glutamate-cysteine ligase family protein [Desulfobulbaceae bacterium]